MAMDSGAVSSQKRRCDWGNGCSSTEENWEYQVGGHVWNEDVLKKMGTKIEAEKRES